MHSINKDKLKSRCDLMGLLFFIILLLPLPSLAAEPDLDIILANLSDQNVVPSQFFNFEVYTQNKGTATSSISTLRYYRSTNALISVLDTEIGTDSIPSLAPNIITIDDAWLMAPSTTGTYYIGACVDSVAGELVTDNQCSDGEEINVVNMPDLVVIDPSVSDDSLMPGQPFEIEAYVRNRGSLPAGGTTLRFYRSTNDTISLSDTPIATDSVIPLNAYSQSYETVSVNAHIAPTGTFWIGACVDSVAGELVTDNQCSVGVQITVNHMTDLAVTYPMLEFSSLPLISGASFVINTSVSNQGTLTSNPTTLRFSLSTDSSISFQDDKIGDFVAVPSLSPDDFVSLDASVNAPLIPGTYWIGACVYSAPNQVDADISNQCSMGVTITVVAPPPPFSWGMFLPAILGAKSPSTKTVFVTDAYYNGDLGGVSGANAECQAAANAAGLHGSYKAWISDSTSSPSTTFTRSDVPYVTVAGVKIADNWTDLTDGTLDNPIDRDELGEFIGADAWTYTNPDGTKSNMNLITRSCNEWKSTSEFHAGVVGWSLATDSSWTGYTYHRCHYLGKHHLYCFQQ